MPILQSRSIAELEEQVGKICREAGYQFFTYGIVKSAPTDAMHTALIISNCQAWHDIYLARQYAKIDPVFIHVRNSTLPFRWEQAMYSTSEQRGLEADARRFGLVYGVSLPVRGGRGDVGVLSMACDGSQGIPSHGLPQIAKLSLLSAYIEEKVRMIDREVKRESNAPMSDISKRERQCLQWSSVGKTSREIGQILGITERTVNFHIGSVVQKLNATCRRHAVTKAISLGLLCV